MRRSNLVEVAILGIVLSLAGTALAAAANEDDSGPAGPNSEELVPGPLDGLTFQGALGPDGKPKDIQDTFVFEDGTFVSKECELRCKYPARPYFVRVNGATTEFISETQCPYKDAKIVWRGTIEGDRIKGRSTWVVNRWYWSVENTFEFEGKLVEKRPTSADTD
jgi:hypothetical protein